VARFRAPTRAELARFGAPAAFLAGVTVAVLLVRAGLSAPEEPATTVAPTATRPTTSAEPTTRPATNRETTAAEPEAEFYTVEAGDTFGTIAEQFGTTVDRLEELNPGVDTTSLRIGQRIRVQ
jgi:LysM repeat protein